MPGKLNKILYLEDDMSIAEIGSMALEDFGGFEIRHCWTGKEAVEVAPEFDPDLCLFDVMVPELDGLEAFKMLRRQERFCNLPVIFMTAKAQRHEVEKYKAAGALDVIIKPFDTATLGRQIAEKWDEAPKALVSMVAPDQSFNREGKQP